MFSENPWYFGRINLCFRPKWIEKKPGEKSKEPIHNFCWHIWHRLASDRPIAHYFYPEENKMDKLVYKADGLNFALEWRRWDSKSFQLVMTGPGYSPDGFSIGTYYPDSLKDVLAQFQKPIVGRSWPPVYTFTKPAHFAKFQGHNTRLAIHAEHYRESGFADFMGHSRTCTIHEQGERVREVTRFMGRFRFDDVCQFLLEPFREERPVPPANVVGFGYLQKEGC